MNIAAMLALIEAVVADYTSFEAGSAITAPTFDLDLTNLGIGKMAITLSAKKVI